MPNPPNKLLGLALGLAVSLSASAAHADTTPTVFATIDSVNRAHNTLELTGIVAGEATPSTKAFDFWTVGGNSSDGNYVGLLNACTQSATLMMNRPGRFTLTVAVDAYNRRVYSCALKRNP